MHINTSQATTSQPYQLGLASHNEAKTKNKDHTPGDAWLIVGSTFGNSLDLTMSLIHFIQGELFRELSRDVTQAIMNLIFLGDTLVL